MYTLEGGTEKRRGAFPFACDPRSYGSKAAECVRPSQMMGRGLSRCAECKIRARTSRRANSYFDPLPEMGMTPPGASENPGRRRLFQPQSAGSARLGFSLRR
jgi:hypothetical protein